MKTGHLCFMFTTVNAQSAISAFHGPYGGSAAPDELHVAFTGPASQEAYHLTINWGGGSGNPATFDLNPGQTTFDYPLPQYICTGTYGITATVSDDDGGSAATDSPLTVQYSNAPPADLSLTFDQTAVNLGRPTILSGSFTDPQVHIPLDNGVLPVYA